eukprot:5298568-Pleurochrysis_carterae.AAC.1
MPPPILRIRAAFWPSGPLAKRRGATLAAAAIPGVHMAKLFGSAAYGYAILNKLAYYYHHNLKNKQIKTYTYITQNIVNIK